MRAGLFDKHLQIQRRTRVRDDATGELVDQWADLGEPVYARMLQGRGLERYAAQQKLGEINVGFELRWDPGLTVLTPDEHRLTAGGFVYDIKGLAEIQRRQGVAVLCVSRTEGLTALGHAPEA